MSASQNHEQPAGIRPADIYFVVFRHKWKILVLTLLGLGAAAGYYFTQKPVYVSEAEVFIRYVSETSLANPSQGGTTRTISQLDMGQTVMNSEIALFTSLDSAKQVAMQIGPEKILAKYSGGNDVNDAAVLIQDNLKVEPIHESCVLYATFRHADPQVVGAVLSDLIQAYQDTHAKVRGIGTSGEALQGQVEQLRMQIKDTEDQIRVAKTNAGVISIEDAKTAYQEEMNQIHKDLLDATASLAGYASLSKPAGTNVLVGAAKGQAGNSTNSTASVPDDERAKYKDISKQLKYLDQQYDDYLQRQGYTDDNKWVKENRDRATAITKSKTELEKKFPSLMEAEASVPGTNATSTLSQQPPEAGEGAKMAALMLRVKELQAEYAAVQGDAARLDDTEAAILDLERRKKDLEGKLNAFQTIRDQGNVNEALGPGNSNIRVIEQPTPARPTNKVYKQLGLLATGGLLLGLAWAFLIEFYLDRSVKRPVDLQMKLHIPFFLSIPDLNHGPRSRLTAAERKQLAYNNGNGETKPVAGALEVTSPRINHALGPHYDALRDRLVNYFESINLTRKPKLVAITSTGKGAGVSTISAGLAASLSETGDGRVLLVDMNLKDGAAQQFIYGKAGCQLDDALTTEKRDNALVQENLYVVSEGSNTDKLSRILPKRFSSLIPKLRASDYDYIIFDMPPVTQTSVTTRLAGFMDTVMLVVESEKTDRDVVQQAHQLLVQSKANVTAVLNKTRNYIPARLQPDIHSDV